MKINLIKNRVAFIVSWIFLIPVMLIIYLTFGTEMLKDMWNDKS